MRKTLVVRMPPDLHEALKRRAKQAGLTVNAFVVSVLRRQKGRR